MSRYSSDIELVLGFERTYLLIDETAYSPDYPSAAIRVSNLGQLAQARQAPQAVASGHTDVLADLVLRIPTPERRSASGAASAFPS